MPLLTTVKGSRRRREDELEALNWYRKAAEQGYPVAQYCLGAAYRHGLGVPQDDHEAASWYRYAADQGVIEVPHNLAIMYHYGQGVSQNAHQAVWLFRDAALRGHGSAGSAAGESRSGRITCRRTSGTTLP